MDQLVKQESRSYNVWLRLRVSTLGLGWPMMMNDTNFILWLLLLFSCLSSCFGSDLDVQCLKDIKESVVDPNGIWKSSWNFDSRYDGFVCEFLGVDCWNTGENRVLGLRLHSLGLQGGFPQGLENCRSIVHLDLSNNNFSGPIPSNLAWQMPFLSSLDLSYNSFSGEIPISISSLVCLNSIHLEHNQLTGQIPDAISLYNDDRLTSFSVADNQLSGTIPWSLQNKFPAASFAGNQGLCSAPLGDCPSRRSPIRISDESSIGAAAGFVVGFVVAFYSASLSRPLP